MNLLGDARLAARFLAGVPSFLQQRMEEPEARAILRRRRARREQDFLDLIRRTLDHGRTNPYPRLFRLAGCQYGDVERLVRTDGVEGTLHALYQAGIYLTVDEFKGRREIRRGSAVIACGPSALVNPRLRFPIPATSGGSAMLVPLDLRFVRAYAANSCLVLAARGGSDWLKAHWSVPGGGTLAKVLEFTAFGAPPARWFSQLPPDGSGLHPRYVWSVRGLRLVSALCGVPLPPFDYAPRERPGQLLAWLHEVRRGGRQVHLFTFVSSAISLCHFARAQGDDLQGVHFLLVGEPLTEARLATIRELGGDVLSRYAANECGTIGYGCLAGREPDDLHLMDDLQAVVQADARRPGDGLVPDAMLVTSLRSSAPFLFLNVSLGDRATLTNRRCGCPLETLGWLSHLHSVRSFEKLTSGGIAYLDGEVLRVLEDVLPRRFGGTMADYQLLEDEAPDGQPRLRLLVHPALGELDPRVVSDTFLAAIGRGSGAEHLTALLWAQAGFLRIERRRPYAGVSGKILHLHRLRQPARGGH